MMVWHFFSLSFLFLSLLFLLSLLLLFLLLPLFCFCSLFVAILHYYSTYLPMILYQPPAPFSVGSSTTRSTIDAGSTSSGSDSISSQGYVMDCFFAIQRSFLSCNRCFQCIIGNRVRPLSVHYFHVQRLQAHYSVQSVFVPHHWWIWKGFWRSYSYHGLTPSYIICWELCPCFQWLWFTFPNQCHRFSTD